MVNKNARINVEDSCKNLQQVRSFLNDASQTVENKNTKDQIQQQLLNVESCLSECENIINILNDF